MNTHTTQTTPTGYYGIEAVPPATPGAMICGACGRAWMEDTTPAGRCPWEDLHDYPEEDEIVIPKSVEDAGARDRAERHVVSILAAHVAMPLTFVRSWPAYCLCGSGMNYSTADAHRAHLATMLSPYPGAQISQ